MKISTQLRLSAGSLAVGFALAATPAVAQDADEEDVQVDTASDSGEENVITVTGSRIRRPNLEGTEPTTTITSEFIEQRNFVNVADALNDLPQIRGSVTPNGGQAAFGQGVNFINNFGLGSNRTLTLINGRRVVSSNSPSLFGAGAPGLQVDTNIIPTALVKQVDIVSTAGAPVYGSDAISGTLNFILDDQYEGLELNATSFITEEGDNFTYRFEGVYGTSFADGRGHLQVSAFFTDVQGVLETSRDFFLQDTGGLPNNFDSALRVNPNLGQDTGPDDGIPPTALFFDIRLPVLSNGGVISGSNGSTFLGPLGLVGIGAGGLEPGTTFQFDPQGNLVPFTIGEFPGGGVPVVDGIFAAGGDGFRFSDFAQVTSDLRRFGANVFANYDVTDTINVFTELQYFDSRADELVQQPTFNTPLFGGVSGALTFQSDNPFLTEQAQGVLAANGVTSFTVSRANVGIADLTGFAETEFLRGVLGARGDLELFGNAWNWETTFTYGQVEINDFRQDINAQNFINATNVTTDAAGNIVCDPTPATPVQAGLLPTADPNCVPFNFFGNNNTPEAIAFVVSDNNSFNTLEQVVFNANIGGTLFDINGNGVGVNVGYEHRNEQGDFIPSEFEQDGLGRGAAVQPVAGEFNLDEVFGEIYVPIISPSNDSFISALDLFARGRYVDNTVNGGFFSWAVGGRLAPIEDIEFRANFTRSFRAPAIGELFLPLSNAFATVPDICNGILLNSDVDDIPGNNPDARLANCNAFNAAVAAFDAAQPAGTPPTPRPFPSNNATIPVQAGGNPTLDNEQSNSWTVGTIIRPRFVPNLSITVDYINIDISDPIFQLTAGALSSACFDNDDFDLTDPANGNAFCSLIQRGPDLQPISDPENPGVLLEFTNGNSLVYEGLQGTLNYRTSLDNIGLPGNLLFRGDLTWVLERSFDDLPVAGRAVIPTDGTVGDPEIAAQFTTNYVDEFWGFGVTANYTAEQLVGTDNRGPSPNDTREFDRADDFVVIDANIFFRLQDDFRINFVVNNLFDRQGQEFFGALVFLNDAFGRSFSASITKQF